MLGRLLATVAVVLALGACGSRTPLRLDDDEALDEFSQAGAAGPASGVGGDSGDRGGAGVGSGGRDGSGAGGHGAENSAGDGSAGTAAGSSSAGQGGTGAGFSGGGFGGGGFGGAGSGGAGFGGASGFPAGQGGVGGMPVGAGEGGASGMAGEILNPHGCATPEPFVLSIDPVGTSGNVRGWLESAAGMVFEEQLPRFVRSFNPLAPVADEAIALWWSIGAVGSDGQGELYFYASDFTNSLTEIAVAYSASRFDDIDIGTLDLTAQTVSAKTGSFVVFRNTVTGETLGLRVDEIFVTADDGDVLCAAVDASWRFLR